MSIGRPPGWPAARSRRSLVKFPVAVSPRRAHRLTLPATSAKPAAGDEVLRDLVLARIIKPDSKLDSRRYWGKPESPRLPNRTVKRRLPVDAGF